MAATQTAATPDDEIDLRDLLGALLDHKWLIGTATGVFMAISVGYAVLGTPIYRADALIQVEQKVPDLPGLSAITQTLGASSSEASTEIALVTSRAVLGKAVDELNLQVEVKPYRFPLFGGWIARRFVSNQAGQLASPWVGLRRYDWGGSKLDVFQLKVPSSLEEKKLTLVAGEQGNYTLYYDGDVMLSGQVGSPAAGRGITMQVRELLANPGARFEVVHHTKLAVIGKLQEDVGAAEQGKDSGIIGLTYDHADPELAATLLDHISQAYVKQNVDRNSAEAAIMGQHAGTSLLVIRFGLNQIREVVLAKQRFEQNGVQIKGAVFNAVERTSNGYYSYGYHEYGSNPA